MGGVPANRLNGPDPVSSGLSMVRLSAIFIAVCMVFIATSCGAVLYLVLGFSGPEAAIVALAALTGLALYHTISTRLRDRSDVGEQIADLSRGTADLARQVAEYGRRLAAIETEVAAQARISHATSTPLAGEIGELGSLVKQLAETVAAHESVLCRPPLPARAEAPIAPAAAPIADVAVAEAAKTADRTELGEPEPQRDRAMSGPFKGMARDAVIALIRDALDAGRVDLYLQPIVTLPQRKVRYYEAMVRMRSADGDVLMPADFLHYAETGGMMPRIDNLMLFRCVQVVRRLLAKNRDISLFCNVSAATLNDAQFFPQFAEFMDANRAIAPSLVFEFTQSAYRSLGPMEFESLAALAEHGFRFSLDNVIDLRIEPRDLSDRGFRFIKAPAALLLGHAVGAATDIHPADFSGLLGRYAIELIAERIESEGTVVDLLDYDVRYGQGFLFSPPRPVRPEAVQGVAERHEGIVREAAAGGDGAALGQPALPGEARPAVVRRNVSGLTQLARGAAASN